MNKPINQQWIQDYCDKLLKIASELSEGAFKQAVLLRVEHTLDLVEAWRKSQ